MQEPIKLLVVDGSNISHWQGPRFDYRHLQRALRALRETYPEAEVSVIVDRSFRDPNRNRDRPADEQKAVQAAVLAQELVEPQPRDRADDLIIEVAARNGVIVSNDLYQKYWSKHPWLTDPSRRLGATYVPVPLPGRWHFRPLNLAVKPDQAKLSVTASSAPVTAQHVGGQPPTLSPLEWEQIHLVRSQIREALEEVGWGRVWVENLLTTGVDPATQWITEIGSFAVHPNTLRVYHEFWIAVHWDENYRLSVTHELIDVEKGQAVAAGSTLLEAAKAIGRHIRNILALEVEVSLHYKVTTDPNIRQMVRERLWLPEEDEEENSE